ncbi:MAG: AarF/UbiB family protein [Actinomycetia bacterium]|nr:AarF/UbiB family protein [Actinomycetes bacterium]
MNARALRIFAVFFKRFLIALVRTRFGLMGIAQKRAIRAVQLRLAFEELGPAFIKLGQLISLRPDMVPAAYVFEMESLRDAVPAMPYEAIASVIEHDFAQSPDELFDDFERVPIGSASIAQVHRAHLREPYTTVFGEVLQAGTPLAIKVVRPGTLETIEKDLVIVERFARRLDRIPALERFNIPLIVDELSASLQSECDLRIEGRISDAFAFNFRDWGHVSTAPMLWPYISRNVLTMGFVEGYHLTEAAAAEAAGVDARFLALHGAEVFMRQVLELGRFHADLHQSNLIMTPDNRICYIDFGIIGNVAVEHREAITQVLVATVYGDAKRAIKYSADLGLVIAPPRQAIVEQKVADLMARTLGATPKDIRGFAIGFLGIMNEERVSVPRGFGLLIKALVVVEGCAQMVYPDIDVTEAAKPYATKLVARQMMNPARIYQRLPAALDAFLEELVG